MRPYLRFWAKAKDHSSLLYQPVVFHGPDVAGRGGEARGACRRFSSTSPRARTLSSQAGGEFVGIDLQPRRRRRESAAEGLAPLPPGSASQERALFRLGPPRS